MMTKEQRINYFLKSMMYVRGQRKIDLTCINVYSSLITFDVYDFDRNVDLSNTFNTWVDRFRNINNINVFVDPNWSYFCQFTNKKDVVMSSEEQIKIYIPLDSSHIENGVERIFSFLAVKNIPHLSKVSKHIRFDDIVIRVSNSFDAELISNFIKSDSYIQEGLIKNNAFAVEKERISYASDKHISYNSIVATLITNYINYSYNNKENVDINSFKRYIERFYREVFINNNYQLLDNKLNHFSINLLTNYQRVIELIYNSLSSNYTYSDYLEYYEKNKKDYYRPMELLQTNVRADEISLLKKALIEFGKKEIDGKRAYSHNDAVLQIYEYIKTNSPIYITKSGGIRDEMVKCDYRNILLEYMSINNLDFSEVILLAKKSILDDAFNSLREKYGNRYDVSYALKRLLILHDYSGFTSFNNSRDNLILGVSVEDIKNLIKNEIGFDYDLFNLDDRNILIETYVNNKKNVHIKN